MITTVAAEAAAARATFFTVFVPAAHVLGRPAHDELDAGARPIHALGPARDAASMTGGGSFRAEVGAEGAFERLGRELSGYYRIGVEKDPADATARPPHEGPGVARSGRRCGPARSSTSDLRGSRLGGAAGLGARVAGPGHRLGLRVTSYLAADPDDPISASRLCSPARRRGSSRARRRSSSWSAISTARRSSRANSRSAKRPATACRSR